MHTFTKTKLLRIFCGSDDKVGHTPLYEYIVIEAKKTDLAGASVFKGVMGFGANSVIHSAKILALSNDLPVVIEIADNQEKLEEFLTALETVFESSKYGLLITLEDIEVLRYSPAKK